VLREAVDCGSWWDMRPPIKDGVRFVNIGTRRHLGG
jgi:hypothetical protein